MLRRLESVMRIGRRIGLSDENGILVAVFIALVIVAITIAAYYIWLAPHPEQYSTINLLDAQKQARNYPQVLVANQNSTFTVYVNVENHMIGDQWYEVQTKVVKNLPALFPINATAVNSLDFTLKESQTGQYPVTVTENKVGSYYVVFELWRQDAGAYVFTQNYCVLNIQVIS